MIKKLLISEVLLLKMLVLSSLLFSLSAQAQQDRNFNSKNNFISEPITMEKLESYVNSNPAINSIEKLLAALPPKMRKNFVVLYGSESFQISSDSHPRIISYRDDARFLLAFNGDPNHQGYDKVEVIEFDEQNKVYNFFELGFDPTRTQPLVVNKNPKRCDECHAQSGNRLPIWDTYNVWPGAYGSVGSKEREEKAFQAFLPTIRSGHPRYSPFVSEKFIEAAIRNFDPKGYDKPSTALVMNPEILEVLTARRNYREVKPSSSDGSYTPEDFKKQKKLMDISQEVQQKVMYDQNVDFKQARSLSRGIQHSLYERRISQLRQAPHFSRFKFALMATIMGCGNYAHASEEMKEPFDVAKLIPSAVLKIYGEAGLSYASIYRETDREYLAEISDRLTRAGIDLSDDQHGLPYQYREKYLPRLAEFRLILRMMGEEIHEFMPGKTRRTTLFSVDPNREPFVAAMLLPDILKDAPNFESTVETVRENEPWAETAFLSTNFKNNEQRQIGCQILKERSLNALKNFIPPQSTIAASCHLPTKNNPDALVNLPIVTVSHQSVLQRCAICHATGNDGADVIPFLKETKLRKKLKSDDSLLEEIRYRISSKDEDEQMPPGKPLTNDEMTKLIEYLKSISSQK